MRFHYKGFWIDPTPDHASERYIAHVRILTDESGADPQTGEVADRADLGRFSREALAIEHAISWAIAWIDERALGPLKRA